MSDDLGDLAEWRGNIESRVSTLEVTFKTQASVRAQMDKDFSDLNLKLDAQGRLLRALADTQSEHTARLTRLEVGQADHTERLTRLEVRMERVEVGLNKVHVGVQTIIGLLDRESGTLPE
jgi:hypothetical protein